MSATKKERQKLLKYWENQIKQWSESGLSQSEYCRVNNLKSNRFTYWKIKLTKQHLPTEFVQVPSPQVRELLLPHPAPAMLKLNIDTGFQIEIPDGFSQATLARTLEVLRRL